MKKLIIIVCTLCTLCTAIAAPARASEPLSVASSNFKFEVFPTKIDGVWYLPLRSTAAKSGFTTKWNAAERKIEISKGAQWTSVIIGVNSYFFAKMAPVALTAAPVLQDGGTMIPVEFFTQILKINLTLENEKFFLNNNDFSEQIGYIQKIEPGAQSTMVYISSMQKTTKMEDMVIVHVFAETLRTCDRSLHTDNANEYARANKFQFSLYYRFCRIIFHMIHK